MQDQSAPRHRREVPSGFAVHRLIRPWERRPVVTPVRAGDVDSSVRPEPCPATAQHAPWTGCELLLGHGGPHESRDGADGVTRWL